MHTDGVRVGRRNAPPEQLRAIYRDEPPKQSHNGDRGAPASVAIPRLAIAGVCRTLRPCTTARRRACPTPHQP